MTEWLIQQICFLARQAEHGQPPVAASILYALAAALTVGADAVEKLYEASINLVASQPATLRAYRYYAEIQPLPPWLVHTPFHNLG